MTVDDDLNTSKEDAVMTSVEEMLEGFDWTAPATGPDGVKKRGADAIEGRLLDELTALDSVGCRPHIDIADLLELSLIYLAGQHSRFLGIRRSYRSGIGPYR